MRTQCEKATGTGPVEALFCVAEATFARLREKAQAWAGARRTRRELMALDDATLKDLGLDRGELPSVAAELEGRAEPTRIRIWKG